MNETATGLSLLFLAGVMNGSFALPMKFTRNWAWENTWLVWTICALFVFPLLLAYSTIPQLSRVYSQAGFSIILLVALCGAGWGVSQVLFGLAVESVGMALTFPVVIGVSAAVGSMIPLIRLHPEKISSAAGVYVVVGLILLVGAVTLCAVAGKKREAAVPASSVARPSTTKGLFFCVLSGVGGSLINIGLAFGDPIVQAAQKNGALKAWSSNAAFLPLLLSGGASSLIYCIYLIRKNRTHQRFYMAGSAGHWLLAAVMGLLWWGSTVTYGASTSKLGQLGTVIGWPLFMSVIVITATFLGMVTGEWRNAGQQPLRILGTGIFALMLAILAFSISAHMLH
jgi:L-rhamnose-H+ transport protein